MHTHNHGKQKDRDPQYENSRDVHGGEFLHLSRWRSKIIKKESCITLPFIATAYPERISVGLTDGAQVQSALAVSSADSEFGAVDGALFSLRRPK